MSDNDAAVVARLLLELSQRLLLAGENPYKARAYARAAESLLTLTIPLEDVIAQNRLREIPGVGAALAEVIRALHQNGTTPRLEAMRADVPASVLEMLKIPASRPRRSCASTSSSRSHPSMSWSRPANKTGSPRARALVRRCKRRCCKASSSCAVHKVSASSTMPTSCFGPLRPTLASLILSCGTS